MPPPREVLQPPAVEARPGTARALVWTVATLALALVVRAWRWDEGLPAFFDEARSLRQALRMWQATGGIDWNPHFFVYPSLTIYFYLALQWVQAAVGTLVGAYGSMNDYLLAFETDPTAHVLLARIAVTVIDLATVMGTIVLGERVARGAGIAAGLLVSIAPTVIDTSNALFVEAHLAVFTIWSLERMSAHVRRGDQASLVAASVLVGLATSCKYPGVLLMIPLAWATAVAGQTSITIRVGRLVVAIVTCFGAFAATSPYVLLDWASASRDLSFTIDMAQRGHLGHLGQSSGGFYLAQSIRDPGIVAMGLATALPALTWRDPGPRRLTILLLLAVVPLGASVAWSSVIAPRYLASLIPVVAVGAAVAAVRLASLVTGPLARSRSLLAALVLVASVFPATLTMLTRPSRDTRDEALAWCTRFLPPQALVIRESGGPPLFSERRRSRVEQSPLFHGASPQARARYQARRTFNDIAWPLFVHGDLAMAFAAPDAPPRRVQLFPEAVDFGPAFYDLRLLALADYVITSSVVRSRYEADSARFAVPVEAYRALDRDAGPVASFAAGPGLRGPDLRVYRITPAIRERWLAELGTLDPGWWLAHVPPDAPIRRETPAGAAPLPDGRPAWSELVDEFHVHYVDPILDELVVGLERAGRRDDAAAIARVQQAWAP